MSSSKKSYTLLELILVIALIGVFAGIGSWLLIFFSDNFLYLPARINADMSVSDALDVVCEGDDTAGGLRFARNINSLAPYGVSFTDRLGNFVDIELESGDLTREINGGGNIKIPYYTSSLPLDFSGKQGRIFQYYDEYGNITTEAGLVRRVEINLIANLADSSRELKTSISLRGLE